MKLLAYIEKSTTKLGAVTDAGVIPLAMSIDEFYARGLGALSDLRAEAEEGRAQLDEDTLTLSPIVPHPGKILCVGLNYRQHAAESNMTLPQYPLLFSKFNNALAAPGEDVPIAPEWTQVDYEAELVAVIGRKARHVSEANALDYVLGYCNGNDISERGLQFRTNQWLIGKSLDKFQPIGPYLVSADELRDSQNLAIRGWLNGEERQNSNTRYMIFSVAQIVAYASQLMTLYPGDIISTGTPEGVIFGMPKDQQRWLKPGDVYTVEVEGLGRLTNRLVSG